MERIETDTFTPATRYLQSCANSFRRTVHTDDACSWTYAAGFKAPLQVGLLGSFELRCWMSAEVPF